jgi:fused signal recognition particle receptor
MVFGFIKKTFQKIYNTVTSPIMALFARPIDEQVIKELEVILLSADTGIKTTRAILDKVKSAWQKGDISQGADLKALLETELISILQTQPYQVKDPLFVLVGINGSGKTTAAAKLAHHYKEQNKRILFIAADTFRAAAVQQLERWAEIIGADIVIGKEGQDPASVIFAGIQKFKQENYDVLIIDTAGRLQTKIHLMKELEKIKRVITAQLPDKKVTTLLTIDAMLGQNSFEQANLFHESTPIDGIILTKMDGTAKGGMVFAITNDLKIPIAYISFGEKPEQFKQFDAHEYVHELLNG